MNRKRPEGRAGRLLRHLISAVIYGLIGLAAGGLTLAILQARSRPDLSPWHTAELDAEFTAEQRPGIDGLAAYLKLEDTLFSQLRETVSAGVPEDAAKQFNRFASGSWSDPGRFPVNWNRTVEMPAENPAAGFLLLHGLTDSPYSFRSIAQGLNARGAWVVGLRIPGHGTAPSGLARVDRHDFTAAVRMAARYLAEKTGADRPLFLAGYSNGAALALEYCLAVLEGEPLPAPSGLLLISPAVAVTPAAALARVNRWLAEIPGLEKLGWLTIEPEFDPFKYNSFPVNAADQIYRLTSDIAVRLDRLDNGSGISGFPPDDPLYGSGNAAGEGRFTLGSLEPRGERGLLRVGIGDLMRLRYNPFYPYLEARIMARYFPSEPNRIRGNGR